MCFLPTILLLFNNVFDTFFQSFLTLRKQRKQRKRRNRTNHRKQRNQRKREPPERRAFGAKISRRAAEARAGRPRNRCLRHGICVCGKARRTSGTKAVSAARKRCVCHVMAVCGIDRPGFAPTVVPGGRTVLCSRSGARCNETNSVHPSGRNRRRGAGYRSRSDPVPRLRKPPSTFLFFLFSWFSCFLNCRKVRKLTFFFFRSRVEECKRQSVIA